MNPPQPSQGIAAKRNGLRAFCTEFWSALRERKMLNLLVVVPLLLLIACEDPFCDCDKTPLYLTFSRGDGKFERYKLKKEFYDEVTFEHPEKDLSKEANWYKYYEPVLTPGQTRVRSQALAASSTSAIPSEFNAFSIKSGYTNATYSQKPSSVSYGTFIAQIATAYSSTSGLVPGRSAGVISFSATESSHAVQLQARFDPLNHGFLVCAMHVEGPVETDLIKPVPFPASPLVLLRIQQTDTQLLFSARRPGGDWIPIYTADAPPPDEGYQLRVASIHLNSGGKIYFMKGRIEGSGIGGKAEGPINILIRDSVAAIASAERKILDADPDLIGATADLNTAQTKTADAINALNTAIDNATLQSSSSGPDALAELQAAADALTNAKAVVSTLVLANAKTQQPVLDAAAFSQHSAMSSLAGGPRLTSKNPGAMLQIASDMFLPFIAK